MVEFKNTKIRVRPELPFEKIVEFLESIGYSWQLSEEKIATVPPDKVNTVFTHTDGRIRWSAMDETCHDWDTHPGKLATITQGRLYVFDEEANSPRRLRFIDALRAAGITDNLV